MNINLSVPYLLSHLTDAAIKYLRFSIVYFLALFLKYLPCSEYFIGFTRPLKLIFHFLYQMFANCADQYKLLLATKLTKYIGLECTASPKGSDHS